MIVNPVVYGDGSNVEVVTYNVTFTPERITPVYTYLNENFECVQLEGIGTITTVKNSLLWINLNYGRMDNQVQPNVTGLVMLKHIQTPDGMFGGIEAGGIYRCDANGIIE